MSDHDGQPLKPGDKVAWAGSGWCSALIGGPGEIVQVSLHENDKGADASGYAEVRVLTEGECLGNRFKRGEVYSFRQSSLRRTEG